ncbi:MAG: NUDIX domain-containing protein [Patescibacteria group bacterium]|nr:NUDIX domain-containing protein [Patescibacteria group bacterium]
MELPQGSIIASGPVIIENNKILLNREQKSDDVGPWMFPGGSMENFDASLEDVCRREAKEEMGIDIKIIKPLKPIMLRENGRVIILIHYLAERVGDIKPGKDVVDYGWHDINNLPENCAPNVYEIIKKIL